MGFEFTFASDLRLDRMVVGLAGCILVVGLVLLVVRGRAENATYHG